MGQEEKLALSIDQAAECISVSPWTIRKWIKTGKLQGIKLGARTCVTREALLKLVQESPKVAEKP
jgi:excisionase family DNA binding protein